MTPLNWALNDNKSQPKYLSIHLDPGDGTESLEANGGILQPSDACYLVGPAKSPETVNSCLSPSCLYCYRTPPAPAPHPSRRLGKTYCLTHDGEWKRITVGSLHHFPLGIEGVRFPCKYSYFSLGGDVLPETDFTVEGPQRPWGWSLRDLSMLIYRCGFIPTMCFYGLSSI